MLNPFKKKRSSTKGAKGGGCPFSGSEGYATAQGRKDWLLAHGLPANADVSQSLQANLDQSQPLYYWQLFSLLGEAPIEDLVRRFYMRVYSDDEDLKFRDAFARISGIEHHISTQTAFWVDVMGGGAAYHGGDYRLQFHHSHNARSVMNAGGAKRWMHHMGNTLCEMKFSSVDVRIKPCLVDFLRTKVKKYAKQHHWTFDERDFEFAERDPEMMALRQDAQRISSVRSHKSTTAAVDKKSLAGSEKSATAAVAQRSSARSQTSAASQEEEEDEDTAPWP